MDVKSLIKDSFFLRWLRDFVQGVVRKSEKEKLDMGDLARQNTITMSQISDYTPPPDYYGQATFSGNGATVAFSFPHGLSFQPWVIATAATAVSFSHATSDATNVTFHFSAAPAAGTDNVVINYILKESNL